ncbi:MAG TPA: hypothetical protein VET30_04830 [Pseudoxanthomonas sp.]|nr:hypothetical protein [Pseudoxanthomonas sp.]
MSITKPQFIAQSPPLCPVCGKASYSRGGVHPQCAVTRADAVLSKARKAKAAAKSKVARPPWTKRCPHCGRQTAARRYACDCGHRFEQPSGG